MNGAPWFEELPTDMEPWSYFTLPCYESVLVFCATHISHSQQTDDNKRHFNYASQSKGACDLKLSLGTLFFPELLFQECDRQNPVKMLGSRKKSWSGFHSAPRTARSFPVKPPSRVVHVAD